MAATAAHFLLPHLPLPELGSISLRIARDTAFCIALQTYGRSPLDRLSWPGRLEFHPARRPRNTRYLVRGSDFQTAKPQLRLLRDDG